MNKNKPVAISKFGEFKNKEADNIIWMTENEFTKIIVNKEASNAEYVISEGIIEPEGFVPDHYHKWEDQTFHVIEGELEAKIGGETVQIGAGDSIHCPKGVSHYMKNIGKANAKLISYIFPGDENGSITERIAHYITTEIIEISDVFIDMHGGDANEDLLTFIGYYNNEGRQEKTDEIIKLAEISGFEYVVS